VARTKVAAITVIGNPIAVIAAALRPGTVFGLPVLCAVLLPHLWLLALLHSLHLLCRPIGLLTRDLLLVLVLLLLLLGLLFLLFVLALLLLSVLLLLVLFLLLVLVLLLLSVLLLLLVLVFVLLTFVLLLVLVLLLCVDRSSAPEKQEQDSHAYKSDSFHRRTSVIRCFVLSNFLQNNRKY
jgi:hypothetical protein